MDYLLNRQGLFYYSRRVPQPFREYDKRRFVRIALKTGCRKLAYRLAFAENEKVEKYWHDLVGTGQTHEQSDYEKVVKRAQTLGFGYMENSELAKVSLDQIYQRLIFVEKQLFSPPLVEAVIGGKQKPVIKLSEALKRFWEYSKDKTFNKSPNQLRKWTAPRERAMRNLITCVGNKPITDLTRDDLLKFRDWWIKRIQDENLGANGANKNFIQLKTIVESVNENMALDIDTPRLFKKLLLDEENERRRLPFTTEYLRDTLLKHDHYSDLNAQAKWVLFAFAETGAGFSELLGLLPEDIYLKTEIPYISITPRNKKPLKTKYRKRTIPLVGFALDAFKACPQGFTDFYDKPDFLSGIINKHLVDRKLMPTDDHSIYSLRHSFQDRLLAVNAPDRVQADLMGHKFNRQAYGDGASLSQKDKWLEKIQLKILEH